MIYLKDSLKQRLTCDTVVSSKYKDMQNNYDFPDHSIHGSSKQQTNRFDYSNQMTSEYFQEIEELSPNEISGDEDYPNLMKCDQFNNSSHQQQMSHSFGGPRHMVMSSDFYKHESNKINLQPNNNCYSNPNNFIQKRRPFPEMSNDNGKKGNEFFRNQKTSQKSNWQPIKEDSISSTNFNNSKVQLNRIVTTQSKIERINVDEENSIEYTQKQTTPPVSKVQSVVQLMNKFEKSMDISPTLKNKQQILDGGNNAIIKQQSLPYPLDFDDDRKESFGENMEIKNKKIGKVANTVKQLQQKLHPHLKSSNDDQLKKNLPSYNNQSVEHLSKVIERKELNNILPEPLSSESSEISTDMKRMSTESDFIKDISPDEPNKRPNVKITPTLSKNMTKEAKMLMQYFQRRRPLLNYLGVGLSDQLWEQVNSLPLKTVRLVYAEDLESIQHNPKQKEPTRLLKRLSVRSSLRQDPRKIALKKKLLQSKIENQNHDSNYSKIDKSLKKHIKDAVTKSLHNSHDISSLEKEEMFNKNENFVNYHQQQCNAKNKYNYNYQKQPEIYENQYEEECQENHNSRYVDHIKNDYYMNSDNNHDRHDNFIEEEHEYIEENRNNFESTGTLQSVDTKTGRFVKKSAAALIAKRHANINDSPVNFPVKSNSSSSIASRHSVPNINNEKNNQEKSIHHNVSYEKEMWNQNIPSNKDYFHNSMEKSRKISNNLIGQRQHLRSAKSVDQLMFESNNGNDEMYDESNLSKFDVGFSKTSSYQQLLHDDYENPSEIDEIGIPRIPPHKSYAKHSTITKSLNNQCQEQSNYHSDYPNNQFLYTGARPFVPKQVALSKNVVDYSNNTLREKKSMTVDSRLKKGTWRLHGSLGKLFKKRAAIRL